MKKVLDKLMGKSNGSKAPKDSQNPSKTNEQLQKENKILKGQIYETAQEKFKSRRSIRKFSTREVDWKVIYEILEAGLNAPCAGGIENTEVIIVSNKTKRNEISRIENQQFWMADAPYFLVIVRDNARLMELYPGEGELYSVQNTAAVITNILMLAHFHDLGACWVESCDSAVIKAALGIPDAKYVDAVIPIGYPMEDPQVQRAPPIAKTYFEKYGNKMR